MSNASTNTASTGTKTHNSPLAAYEREELLYYLSRVIDSGEAVRLAEVHGFPDPENLLWHLECLRDLLYREEGGNSRAAVK